MQTGNVEKFFEIYNSSPELQARAKEAEQDYPGCNEIREAVVEYALLPLAEELGLPFTVKELRVYETCEKMHRLRDVPMDENEPEDLPEFWLIDKGWDLEEVDFGGGMH